MSQSMIAYFTWSGNAERLAKYLRTLTGGRLFHIEAREAYPKFYNMTLSRAAKEKHQSLRPELTSLPEEMDGYDTIYLVYPNWWNSVPMPIFSFLESVDLRGKCIRPLCTSGGSGIENSVREMRKVCPQATVEDGILVLDSVLNEPETWERVTAWATEKKT